MGTKTQATDVGLDAFEQAWAEFFASVRRSKGRAATEEGRRIVRRKQREVSARRRAVYESLSESEREQAVHLMHRLAGLIEDL